MTYNDELYHWGIKGMKWGERRYQNKDGTLTEAGKKRYDREVRESPGKKTPKVDAGKWVKDDLSRSRRLTDETSGMASKLKNINDTAIKNKPKPKMDLSNMTDKEMRDQINRALLEKQYNDMFAPQKVSKGQEYASKILDTTVAVLGVTGSALGIALAIKELKG